MAKSFFVPLSRWNLDRLLPRHRLFGRRALPGEPLRSIPGKHRAVPEVRGDGPASAAWTADGAEGIIGASFAGQNTLVRLAPRAGAQPQLIPGIGDNSQQPSLARGGGRLAFSQGKTTSSIWRMPLDPKSDSLPQRVTATSRSDTQAELSPDGARIVFSSNRSGNIDIWIAHADGSNPVLITSNLLRAQRPRWSPDSRRIAFAARPGGNVDVYVVEASGGSARRLTTHPAEDASAQWSRDGRWVYFSSNRTGRRELWKIPPDGSTPEIQVTQNGGQVSIESQDGGSLLFTKFGEPGLFRMPAQGGAEEKISDVPTVNFDLAGDQLYFLQGRAIQRLDLSTKKVTDVIAADAKMWGGPSGFPYPATPSGSFIPAASKRRPTSYSSTTSGR